MNQIEKPNTGDDDKVRIDEKIIKSEVRNIHMQDIIMKKVRF